MQLRTYDGIKPRRLDPDLRLVGEPFIAPDVSVTAAEFASSGLHLSLGGGFGYPCQERSVAYMEEPCARATAGLEQIHTSDTHYERLGKPIHLWTLAGRNPLGTPIPGGIE